MDEIILLKKETARLNIKLGETQMYVTKLEEKLYKIDIENKNKKTVTENTIGTY
ncbi:MULTISPECIES: hypothetical protein [Paenibacillus]|jgi:hypothetical protein|uniref:hypothetical protein n=1 Tax=Paenibacillus TaxID=44249 RepID=UPI0004AE07A9|nr:MULTISPECIES: hypothetical protein [Paenibacillus]